VLAAWFGLLGGLIDLGMIHLRRDVFHATLYYEQGRHFHWVVPVANLAVMMVPGFFVAGLIKLRPALVSGRSAAWMFSTLAIWGPLLRFPLYGAATLVLAAGAARGISCLFDSSTLRRFALRSLPVLAGLVGLTAVISITRQALAESQARARLPAAPAGARNVILIVMDTVRAASLGLYGYPRDTSPCLARWANEGVRFEWAIAAAPWTFPSHCTFMTGQWPSTLGAHWLPTLEPAYPTLAGFLSSRGYLTAGFAANTYWCSYESGMNRGFVHYEDYPLSLGTILGSTMPGRWILENFPGSRGFYRVKWIRAQSRDAQGINRSFLNWLSREGHRGRPFFAFLNYLDAHEPFVPPDDRTAHFGLRPQSRADSTMLLEYWDLDKLKLGERHIELARDSYDDCIAALDQQLGLLLDELDRRKLLSDTLVIITSDHGEQFGEHGVFNHGFSVYAQEVHVPLLLISKDTPKGLSIPEPVSLRDIPATVVDLAGLAGESPLPGRSVAECWRSSARSAQASGAWAASEVDIPAVIGPERGHGPPQRGFAMSLFAQGLHYLVDVRGNEELYELASDPRELRNLKDDPRETPALDRFRNSLGEFLRRNRVTSGVAGDYQKQLGRLLENWAPPPSIGFSAAPE
jgi:arylsulfatase A-like enzyme